MNTKENYMDQDIYHLLKKDHREVEQLFQQIMHNRGGAGHSRESLFSKVVQELTPHLEAEEKSFYSVLERHPETKDLMPEAYQEHKEAQQVMKQIQGMSSAMGDGWISKVQELQKAIDHHVKDEEGKIFTASKKALDEKQAQEIGTRFQQEKEQIKQKSGAMAMSSSGPASTM
jgi:hemerythrin superfamily protein